MYRLLIVALCLTSAPALALTDIDPAGIAPFQGSNGTVASVFLTTNMSPDVCFVMALAGSVSHAVTATVTGGGLTWTSRGRVQRAVGTNNADLEEWWAPCSSPQAGVAITVTYAGGTVDDWAVFTLGMINVTNINAPFDTSFPTGALTVGGTTAPGPLLTGIGTTSSPVYLMLLVGETGQAYGGFASCAGAAPSSGWGALNQSIVGSSINNIGGVNFAGSSVAFFSLPAPVSGWNAGITGSFCAASSGPTGAPWGMMADAIRVSSLPSVLRPFVWINE